MQEVTQVMVQNLATSVMHATIKKDIAYEWMNDVFWMNKEKARRKTKNTDSSELLVD